MTYVRRLSSKGQVTVPKGVREKLELEAGDFVAYEVTEAAVTLRRVEPFDHAFHAAVGTTLDEWMWWSSRSRSRGARAAS